MDRRLATRSCVETYGAQVFQSGYDAINPARVDSPGTCAAFDITRVLLPTN